MKTTRILVINVFMHPNTNTQPYISFGMRSHRMERKKANVWHLVQVSNKNTRLNCVFTWASVSILSIVHPIVVICWILARLRLCVSAQFCTLCIPYRIVSRLSRQLDVCLRWVQQQPQFQFRLDRWCVRTSCDVSEEVDLLCIRIQNKIVDVFSTVKIHVIFYLCDNKNVYFRMENNKISEEKKERSIFSVISFGKDRKREKKNLKSRKKPQIFVFFVLVIYSVKKRSNFDRNPCIR